MMAKWTFSILLMLSVAGGLLILTVGQGSISDIWFSILVFLARGGVAGVFAAVYIGHARMFPILFAVSSIGFCNVIARVGGLIAPEIAEIEGTTPIIVFTVLSALTALASVFLREKVE